MSSTRSRRSLVAREGERRFQRRRHALHELLHAEERVVRRVGAVGKVCLRPQDSAQRLPGLRAEAGDIVETYGSPRSRNRGPGAARTCFIVMVLRRVTSNIPNIVSRSLVLSSGSVPISRACVRNFCGKRKPASLARASRPAALRAGGPTHHHGVVGVFWLVKYQMRGHVLRRRRKQILKRTRRGGGGARARGRSPCLEQLP